MSVIIPTYNRAAYLPLTLESVLEQTYRDFEVIVVDDGSTDDTRQVLERYSGRILALFQTNQREGAARNHGIRHAQGEYLAFLDSDDLWLPHKLELDVAALDARPAAGLVYSRVEYISSHGERLGTRPMPSPEGDIFRALVLDNFITLSTVTTRREALQRVGLFTEDRDLSGSMDWEAWVRIAAKYPVTHVPRVTTLIRVHEDNMLSDGAYMERAMLKATELVLANPDLREHLAGFEHRVCASMYQAIAVNHYSGRDMAAARRWLTRSARAWPPQALRPTFVATLFKSFLGAGMTLRVRQARRALFHRIPTQPRPRTSRAAHRPELPN